MIGILLAIALSTQCVHTGTTPTGFLLTCGSEHVDIEIPVSEWPREWHGPELGFTYQLDANGQPLPSLPTLVDQFMRQQRHEAARERQLRELRRWRARG